MTVIDYIILAVLLFFGATGLRRGLLRQVADIIAIGVGVYIAIKYHSEAGSMLGDLLKLKPDYESIVGFGVLWVGIVILVGGIGYILHKFIKHTPLGIFNAIGGGIVGLIKGMIIIIPVIVMIIGASTDDAPESLIINHSLPYIKVLIEPVKPYLDFSLPVYNNEFNKLI